MELFCQSAEEPVSALNLREKNYFDLMTPPSFMKNSDSRPIPENDIDFHSFATLPLLDQIRIIMKHGESNIIKILKKEFDKKEHKLLIITYIFIYTYVFVFELMYFYNLCIYIFIYFIF